MLDHAEQVFNMIAEALLQNDLKMEQTFGHEDMIHVLPEFEGDTNVMVMTADDFLTRCAQIGVPELS